VNSSKPQDYKQWMRLRFPMLNQRIDDGNAADVNPLLDESLESLDAMTADIHTGERERFTYISMMHAALYHHKKKAAESNAILPNNFGSALNRVETVMTHMANSIGVEHRFLSVFYLFYNPEIPDLQGKFAQFRPSEYETAFLRVNREGTLQYKLAANALYNADDLLHHGFPSFESIKSFLEAAIIAFQKISHGNSLLLKTPGGEEFKFLTQYFGEVQIGGKALRGINAGDQPWSYVIDLVLGVDLKRVFQQAFEGTASERDYLAHAKTSAEVIAYEFQSSEYLHQKYLLPEDYEFLMIVIQKLIQFPEPLTSSISNSFSPEERFQIAEKLHEVMKHYLAASNVHFQLAKRFVPKNSEGEQIGSAGTNIVRFLKDGLNAEREYVMHNLESNYPELLKSNTKETISA
jgi:Domain of unknown function (DUF1864)